MLKAFYAHQTLFLVGWLFGIVIRNQSITNSFRLMQPQIVAFQYWPLLILSAHLLISYGNGDKLVEKKICRISRE